MTIKPGKATSGTITPGAYWLFAVRPITPQIVYPPRYQASAQLPDGPRHRICPLAVISWTGGVGTLVQDCRNRFVTLITPPVTTNGGPPVITSPSTGPLTGCGCCTVTIQPGDLTGTTFQALLAPYQANNNQVAFCLMPGTYVLTEPIQLNNSNSNITITGGQQGVILSVDANSISKFRDGMIVITESCHVTLSGLRFEMPLVPFQNGSPPIIDCDEDP